MDPALAALMPAIKVSAETDVKIVFFMISSRYLRKV
jgi:hypothetical protein